MSHLSEPDSDQLLDDLRHATSIESYLEEMPKLDCTLSSYLSELLDKKGLKRSEVIEAAGIGSTFGYYIFRGERGCGRDTALKLALGMGLNLIQTQRLLTRANQARLWPKNPRDAVIIRAIDAGFTRQETDEELFRLGFDSLMDA